MIFTKDYIGTVFWTSFTSLTEKIHLSYIIVFEHGRAHCIYRAFHLYQTFIIIYYTSMSEIFCIFEPICYLYKIVSL